MLEFFFFAHIFYFLLPKSAPSPARTLMLPLQIFRCQSVPSPDGGGSRHRVEIVEVQQAGNCLVVIASYKDFSQVARTGRYFIWTGPISNDIPEIHRRIERGSVGEGGFQGFEVCVDIAEQQYSQGAPDRLPIID